MRFKGWGDINHFLGACFFVFLLLPGLVAAEPLKVLEFGVSNDREHPSIDITFNQTIRYHSHYPAKRGRSLTINLDLTPAAAQELGTQPGQAYRERIPLGAERAVPIAASELIVDDTGARLEIEFRVPVNFQILQLNAANRIQIKVLDQFHAPGTETSSVPGGTLVTELTPEEIFRRGKQALQDGDNALAIRIFSKLVSLPENKYTRDALELLAVARARNDQLAQAILIFRQYLKKYPEGDGSVRVRQRLAEILAGDYRPQEKLKEAKRSEPGEAKYHSFATLGQYYYYAQSSIEGESSIPDTSFLSTQVTSLWRKQELGREVKHFVYVNHTYDIENKDSGDGLINTLYSRLKDAPKKYTASAGRQSSYGGGVLGRFDGLDFNYAFAEHKRMGLSLGAPVDTSQKERVQKEKRFYSLRFELDDLIKDWFIQPYYYYQTIESISDREAVGVELRFFNQVMAVFNQIDYDTFFNTLNIYLLRLQYSISPKTRYLFNVDFRRSPLLESSRAVYADPQVGSMAELLQTKSEDEIRQSALDLTGESKYVSIGLNNQLSVNYQLDVDLTQASQVLRSLENGEVAEFRDAQKFLSVRLGRSNLFSKNDSLFSTLRLTDTDSYSETLLLLTHRFFIGKSRWQTRIRVSERDEQGNVTQRFEPSVKYNYKKIKNADIEVELGMEQWKYGGDSLEPDFSRRYINLGYQYFFR